MSTAPLINPDTEAAYDQSKWSPNMADVLARYALLSDSTRAAIGEPESFSYGSGPNERLDVYTLAQKSAPALIFVHGGGWRGGSAKEFAFPAEMLLNSGINFVALEFSNVTETGGELSVLVEQVRRAVFWLFEKGTDLGIDTRRLFLFGHSSGAHLAAMALSTDWTSYGLTENPIKGGILISGIYDLGPLRQTSRSNYIHIDDRAERELSPIHQLSQLTSPILIGVGSAESPAFLGQSREYSKAAMAADKDVELIVGERYNHFEIVETFASSYAFLGRNVIDFISANR